MKNIEITEKSQVLMSEITRKTFVSGTLWTQFDKGFTQIDTGFTQVDKHRHRF